MTFSSTKRSNGFSPFWVLGGLEQEQETFREGDDVVVLVAEAPVAAPESAADDVAGGVLPPAFRVPPRHHSRLLPARRSGLFIEGPRAHLRAPAAAAPPAVVPRTGRGRALHSDPVLSSCCCHSFGAPKRLVEVG